MTETAKDASGDQAAPVPGDAVARRMTRGFLSLTGGRAVGLVLQFGAFAIIAETLGPSKLGVYSFAIAFLAVFRFVTEFGFRVVVQRDAAQQPEREQELVANLLYLRVGLGLLAYALLASTVLLAGFRPDEQHAALVAGLLLVFLSLESLEIILENRLRMAPVAGAELVKAVVLFGGAVIVRAQGGGVVAFLALYVGANAIRLVLPGIVALRMTPLHWRPKPALWVTISRTAAFLGLAQLCIALYYRVDLLMLAAWKPPADVGQYGAAYQFLDTFILVPSMAMTILAPVMSRSFVEGPAVLQRRYRRVMHLLSLVAFPLAVGGAMTAFRVLPVLPGFGEYDGAGEALSVLSVAAGCIFFGTALSGILVSGHLQRRLALISALGLVVNIALNVALIPPFSYLGTSVATSVTGLTIVGACVWVARRKLGLVWPVAEVAHAARATLVMAVVLALAYPLAALVQLGLGGIAYVVALLPTRSLRPTDLDGLAGSEGDLGRVVERLVARFPEAREEAELAEVIGP